MARHILAKAQVVVSTVESLAVERTEMKIIVARIQEADKPNANGRIYPREVLEKAIADQEAKGRTWVTLGMQGSTTVDLSEVAGQAGNWHWDGDTLCAEIAVMDTPKGKIVKELLESVQPDYRFAGIGTVNPDGTISDYRITSVGVLAPGSGA